MPLIKYLIQISKADHCYNSAKFKVNYNSCNKFFPCNKPWCSPFDWRQSAITVRIAQKEVSYDGDKMSSSNLTNL